MRTHPFTWDRTGPSSQLRSGMFPAALLPELYILACLVSNYSVEQWPRPWNRILVSRGKNAIRKICKEWPSMQWMRRMPRGLQIISRKWEVVRWKLGSFWAQVKTQFCLLNSDRCLRKQGLKLTSYQSLRSRRPWSRSMDPNGRVISKRLICIRLLPLRLARSMKLT